MLSSPPGGRSGATLTKTGGRSGTAATASRIARSRPASCSARSPAVLARADVQRHVAGKGRHGRDQCGIIPLRLRALLVDADIGADQRSGPAAEPRQASHEGGDTLVVHMPMRLITAPSSRRNSRGRSLPACGRGVTVPSSIAPNPSRSRPAAATASLSNPAASPIGLVRLRAEQASRQHRGHRRRWHARRDPDAARATPTDAPAPDRGGAVPAGGRRRSLASSRTTAPSVPPPCWWAGLASLPGLADCCCHVDRSLS